MIWVLITLSFILQSIKLIIYKDVIEEKWKYLVDKSLFVITVIYYMLFFSFLSKWVVDLVKLHF